MRYVELDDAIRTAKQHVVDDYLDMLRAMIMDLTDEGRLDLDQRRLAMLHLQDFIEGQLVTIENALRVS